MKVRVVVQVVFTSVRGNAVSVVPSASESKYELNATEKFEMDSVLEFDSQPELVEL